ncbi:MAG: hypothetical protein M9890_15450 [Thermomicrobiales bacterium]|nr:hypothetical protein [Thermomicrobiales bacterium]
MQSAEQPQRRRWLLIGVAAICLIVAIWAIEQGRGDETGDQSASSAAGIVRESDGVTIRLDNVDATQIQTELTFTVTLPDEAVESHVPDVLGPIFPGNQLKLDGIEPQTSGLNIQMKPHQTGETSLTMTLTLGPVTDPAQGATVTFANLPFALDEGGPVVVDGPWEFPLQPELFSAMKSTTSIALGKSVASQGLTITVDRVTNSDAGLFVNFTIASERTGATDRATNEVRLNLEDGSTIVATQIEQLDGDGGSIQSNGSNTFVATFPPPKESDLSATVSFGPFSSGVPETALIVINDPFGDWSSEPLILHGERLEVTQVTIDEATGELTALVENTEPVESATRMFGSPMGHLMTATDTDGNVFIPVMGATSLRKSEDGTLGAGEHGAIFAGIDPATPMLTLSSSQTGEFLDGPWEIDVQLP